MTLTVRVVSPDKTVWDTTAEEVPAQHDFNWNSDWTRAVVNSPRYGCNASPPSQNQDWVAIALMGGFAEIENNK